MQSNHKSSGNASQVPSTTGLESLGWQAFFQEQLAGPGQADQLELPDQNSLVPARVIGVHRHYFQLSQGQQEWLATAAGGLHQQSEALYPAVGDWVLAQDALIFRVLKRKSCLLRAAAGAHGRKEPGAVKEQVIGANLDTVWIVCGLDRDFNLRRLERYLTMVYNCGLSPVIVLTKADLHQEPEQCVAEVEGLAFGVPVHLLSVEDESGLASLSATISRGETIALVGSSGAGKSTLVNRLCGERLQATGSVSDTVGKGKHTTTTRELIMLPSGGMLIDNPGMREIAFGQDRGALSTAFPEIQELAVCCRFQDCSHSHEPGCELRAAISRGELSPQRLESYLKMQRELQYLSSREQRGPARVERELWKGVSQKAKAIKKKRKYE
ncbi:ribosome small subunit-dependent GTPase A [Desulfogranum mediterraneum]|uniref:ribosome small subunit-dependent GTPase A n=1 Tax=Desulfogranum mediterraneum TaxID=160661 RepID=UPI00040FBD41|nr:ribosome small subunit-dependent GTPase A [Desulfogranum mediterraneum]